MNGTFIDCVKVSDSQIHDGETLTLGGGAGLQPGERSDLLASDLVFRFELVDETRAASMGVTASADEPSSQAADPGAAAVSAPSVLEKSTNMVPPSPVQEGEGKDGDDEDDVSMLGAGSLDAGSLDAGSLNAGSLDPGLNRKRRGSSADSDNKRRKVGDTGAAAKSSSSSSSSNEASSTPPEGNPSDGPSVGASSKPRDEAQPQSKQMNSLKDEVKCAVCYDYFFNACTLQCSHSFCQPCIEEWLHKKHECPVCRAKVESRPNRSNQLDNMVQLVMDNTERRAFEQRKRRHTEKMNRQNHSLESLRKRLEEASAKNETFLSIKDEWTQGQKATFEQGVNQYRGNAREQYCDATGLTREFVETSPLPALLRAAVNVGLVSQGDSNEHPNLRKRMHMFISYG